MFSPKLTFDNFEQLLKAKSPIDVTLPGISIPINDEQPEKALLPIDVTLYVFGPISTVGRIEISTESVGFVLQDTSHSADLTFITVYFNE